MKPWTRDYKSGWMTKRGAVRKNWKKRFFVVRSNFSVDYYANEEVATPSYSHCNIKTGSKERKWEEKRFNASEWIFDRRKP